MKIFFYQIVKSTNSNTPIHRTALDGFGRRTYMRKPRNVIVIQDEVWLKASCTYAPILFLTYILFGEKFVVFPLQRGNYSRCNSSLKQRQVNCRIKLRSRGNTGIRVPLKCIPLVRLPQFLYPPIMLHSRLGVYLGRFLSNL